MTDRAYGEYSKNVATALGQLALDMFAVTFDMPNGRLGVRIVITREGTDFNLTDHGRGAQGAWDNARDKVHAHTRKV